MGAFYETIPESMIDWILKQKMFWVATAPLSASGHVNVSPKGGEYFGVLDNRTFWYMELTGSGSETVAHLHEPGNGRITIMLNAFDGPPRIVRLWGKGKQSNHLFMTPPSYLAGSPSATSIELPSASTLGSHSLEVYLGYGEPRGEGTL